MSRQALGAKKRATLPNRYPSRQCSLNCPCISFPVNLLLYLGFWWWFVFVEECQFCWMLTYQSLTKSESWMQRGKRRWEEHDCTQHSTRGWVLGNERLSLHILLILSKRYFYPKVHWGGFPFSIYKWRKPSNLLTIMRCDCFWFDVLYFLKLLRTLLATKHTSSPL